jgi:ABC-type sugar transport system ATPase subunit
VSGIPDPTAESGAIALSATAVTKRFTGVAAIGTVSLQVASGTVHALLGGNGSGKSTLIKALAGIQPADEGQINIGKRTVEAAEMTPRIARSCGLRFVHQQLPVFADLTVAENLAIGHGWLSDSTGRIKWREQNNMAADVLARFSIAARPKDPLGYYSVATQTMVTVPRAMQDLDAAGILILDEPTSAFPPAQVDVLLDFVRKSASQGHAVVYVTHRLDEVLEAADRATILRDGRLDTTLQRKELSHRRLAEAIIGPAATASSTAWQRRRSGAHPAVEVSELTGGPVREASFSLRPGEIVGLAGLLGSGRSTMLKLIFGALPSTHASVTIDGLEINRDEPREAMAAGVAYVPENRLLDAAFTTMRLGCGDGCGVGHSAATPTEEDLEHSADEKPPAVDDAGEHHRRRRARRSPARGRTPRPLSQSSRPRDAKARAPLQRGRHRTASTIWVELTGHAVEPTVSTGRQLTTVSGSKHAGPSRRCGRRRRDRVRAPSRHARRGCSPIAPPHPSHARQPKQVAEPGQPSASGRLPYIVHSSRSLDDRSSSLRMIAEAPLDAAAGPSPSICSSETRTTTHSGCAAVSRRAASNPSIPGMYTSIRTRSGRS